VPSSPFPLSDIGNCQPGKPIRGRSLATMPKPAELDGAETLAWRSRDSFTIS
jgi:hypothetical protein